MASWQELEPQLLALLDLDSAARSARLAQLAAEQPEMASELSRLLDAAEQTRWDAQMAGGAALEVVQSLGAQLERDQDRTGARSVTIAWSRCSAAVAWAQCIWPSARTVPTSRLQR